MTLDIFNSVWKMFYTTEELDAISLTKSLFVDR